MTSSRPIMVMPLMGLRNWICEENCTREKITGPERPEIGLDDASVLLLVQLSGRTAAVEGTTTLEQISNLFYGAEVFWGVLLVFALLKRLSPPASWEAATALKGFAFESRDAAAV